MKKYTIKANYIYFVNQVILITFNTFTKLNLKVSNLSCDKFIEFGILWRRPS